ncbi:hypothetical protein F8M41_026588 [Gigaspora margarita]|uniref:Uncharacterized protein n=1 Tax=Gigaspora margarita TaxID=4874 RepID=A0A8H3XJ22_GIGMA|nr:hypothetical protein F8M41_026588 [Gigaspora margarita]
MIQYDNYHVSPQLVDRDELRFYENEMLKYSYPQPIISTSDTLDAESNASAPEAIKIDSRIPDLIIINESHTGPIENNIASFREQEKGSEMMPFIYFDTTKIPFTISDQFYRTIPNNISLTEHYRIFTNDTLMFLSQTFLSIKTILNIFRKLEKMFNDNDNEALM